MTEGIQEEFKDMIRNVSFPCVAAKDALKKDNIDIHVAGHLACPADDREILNFIYGFTTKFRSAEEGFYSAAVLFPTTPPLNEEIFERMLFARLRALHAIDAESFKYDKRVAEDPMSQDFSFSLMEEAFFIIGVHPQSSRLARQFPVPAIIFNPHIQFDKMRRANRYEKMKTIVRKRDVDFSGSVNPMLADFGTRSEVFQYSGKLYGNTNECPFKNNYVNKPIDMDAKKHLAKDIDIAVSNTGKHGKTPIENITESLDNSPVWPAGASEIKKTVENKIDTAESADGEKKNQ